MQKINIKFNNFYNRFEYTRVYVIRKFTYIFNDKKKEISYHASKDIMPLFDILFRSQIYIFICNKWMEK
jgi:hypothetical protein